MTATTPTHYRTHTCGDLRLDNDNNTVTLSGWVQNRRDHGGVIFIDLRDRYGLTQVVFDPEHNKDVHAIADTLRSEWVIQVTGVVRPRPDNQANKNLATGDIELLADELKVMNECPTPPFEVDEHATEPNEELRLEYRYLDLRRPRLQQNLAMRHKMMQFSHQYFSDQGFMNIDTPMMVKGTPEGSREYMVPSRLYPGEFYVLPQAPQQLKQMLMLAGYDKYYQFARCFRDEDLRGDRQPEFTQLDVEMSFVGEQDVMNFIEGWAIALTKAIRPDVSIMSDPFPVMSYHDVMNTYGSDKPDIRYELKLSEATDLFRGSGIGFIEGAINAGGVVKALVVPNGSSFTRKEIDSHVDLVMRQGAAGMAYLLFDETGEVRGSLAKFFDAEAAAHMQTTLGANKGDLIYFISDEWEKAVTYLGVLRQELAKHFDLIDHSVFAYLWVNNFPMFEKKEDGSIQAAHHPFTLPREEDMELLRNPETRMQAKAYTYDVVLNGYEVIGGSVRIHDQKLQQEVLEMLGLSDEEMERQFGHLLKAFQYGLPPHAGCAVGFDRMVMIFCDEPNIREVMAFPKNQKARDLMFNAPTPMPKEKLDEANISILED